MNEPLKVTSSGSGSGSEFVLGHRSQRGGWPQGPQTEVVLRLTSVHWPQTMRGMTSDDQSTGLQTKVFTPGERHKLHRSGIITFTRAAPNDTATITAMFMRCSPQSRLRRFFRLVPSAPPKYLEEVLADRDKHHAFVIRWNGETIGLAELHLTGLWSGDLALIVEDSFQRQGVGTV